MAGHVQGAVGNDLIAVQYQQAKDSIGVQVLHPSADDVRLSDVVLHEQAILFRQFTEEAQQAIRVVRTQHANGKAGAVKQLHDLGVITDRHYTPPVSDTAR
jgi:hypothetical protein